MPNTKYEFYDVHFVLGIKIENFFQKKLWLFNVIINSNPLVTVISSMVFFVVFFFLLYMTSSELSKEEAGTLYVVGGFYQVRGKQ